MIAAEGDAAAMGGWGEVMALDFLKEVVGLHFPGGMAGDLPRQFHARAAGAFADPRNRGDGDAAGCGKLCRAVCLLGQEFGQLHVATIA